MKNITKKSVIVLIGILSISLVAGNVLFAGGVNESPSGLIAADDAAFISSNFSADTGTHSDRVSNQATGLITAQDAAFAATPFNGALVASSSSGNGSSQSVVNSSDIGFVRNGGGADISNLVCVVDGVQVSGQACVN
jgi:hypothetical protein